MSLGRSQERDIKGVQNIQKVPETNEVREMARIKVRQSKKLTKMQINTWQQKVKEVNIKMQINMMQQPVQDKDHARPKII